MPGSIQESEAGLRRSAAMPDPMVRFVNGCALTTRNVFWTAGIN
jgi:hypothetical protein